MSDLKIIAIADTHLKNVDKYGTRVDGVSSRLEDNLEGIKKSIQHALDVNADYWIHLGDVYDKINPSELLRKKFFETIAPIIGKIPIIILIGNHDTDLKSTYSLMADKKLLDSIDPSLFKIVSEPAKVNLKGYKTILLPWVKEEKIVKLLKSTTGALVFGHLEVKGAQPSGTEFILREGITPKLFNKHLMSFFGHYHKAQEASKWMYLGSSHKVDMGERGQSKRFLEINLTGEEVTYEEFLIDKRRFIQRTITEEEPGLPICEKGDIIKLIIEGRRNWVFSQDFRALKKELRDLGAQKVVIETKIIKAKVEDKKSEFDSSLSWEELVEAFCKEKEAKDKTEYGKKLFRGEVEIESK